jgi:predicted amidohydrolase YtcJ
VKHVRFMWVFSVDRIESKKGILVREHLSRSLFTSLILVSSLAVAATSAPDTILINGKIFTSAVNQPYVQALAIKGDRITAIGTSSELKLSAGTNTRMIDLGGRTVIPGINDAHDHLYAFPPQRVDIQLESFDPTWPEVEGEIKKAMRKTPPGTLIAVQIGKSIFSDPTITRDSLDRLSPAYPVELGTFTGHAAILNSAALTLDRIPEDQPNLPGARFERDAHGRLTGVLREYAVDLAERNLTASTSHKDALAAFGKTLAQAAKYGITTIQDMSETMPAERCAALMAELPTPIRIRVIRMRMPTARGLDTTEGKREIWQAAPLVYVSGTKWMLDGVGIEGTFTPRSDYPFPAAPPFDDIARKLPMTFSKQQIRQMLQRSRADNDQLMVHVSGYLSAAAMIEAMQAMGGAHAWRDRRVRFEHGDALFPDLVPKVKALGIIVVQNPTHFSLGQSTLEPELFKLTQPLRSLLEAGIPVAFGSDGPLNPYLNIMLAITHPNRHSEAISREDAVRAYTLTSAYAEFAEDEKGSLEAGKLADLAVLSQDIFAVPVRDLPKTTSLLTLVGGQVAYDDHQL